MHIFSKNITRKRKYFLIFSRLFSFKYPCKTSFLAILLKSEFLFNLFNQCREISNITYFDSSFYGGFADTPNFFPDPSFYVPFVDPPYFSPGPSFYAPLTVPPKFSLDSSFYMPHSVPPSFPPEIYDVPPISYNPTVIPYYSSSPYMMLPSTQPNSIQDEFSEIVVEESMFYEQGALKTEICNKWKKTGSCAYGKKCRFAHGFEEMRSVIRHPNYRTKPCQKILVGEHCPYADRCHYSHALAEKERGLKLLLGFPIEEGKSCSAA